MTSHRAHTFVCSLVLAGAAACGGPEGQWTAIGSLPDLRHSAGAAVLGGKVYYVGGVIDGCASGGPECQSARVDIYDPISKQWTVGPPLPSPRSRAAVVSLSDDLYVMGGEGMDATGTTFGERVSNFQLKAGQWTNRAALPYPRAAASGEVLMGRIYLVGGSRPDLVSYDPASDTWASHAPVPTPRRQVGTCAQGTKLLVAGGWIPGTPERASVTAELYDAATDTWKAVAPLPTARGGLGGGRIQNTCYLIGGQYVTDYETKIAIGSNEGFRFDSESWDRYRDMPTLRPSRAFAVLDDDLYVLGGLSVRIALSGATFERFSPIPKPAP